MILISIVDAVQYFENFDLDNVTPVKPEILRNLLQQAKYPDRKNQILVWRFH